MDEIDRDPAGPRHARPRAAGDVLLGTKPDGPDVGSEPDEVHGLPAFRVSSQAEYASLATAYATWLSHRKTETSNGMGRRASCGPTLPLGAGHLAGKNGPAAPCRRRGRSTAALRLCR
ncbi:MAG: hypothetical protein KC620_08555 [Myxococcales bacterium]|nr:hypothetical protein [Myxococcales bacterium]